MVTGEHMTRKSRTELSDKVQIGDVIRPFQGQKEDGKPYASSPSGRLRKPRDTSVTYVVEDARMDGGGYNGPAFRNDYFPDGWQVTARKLNPNGTYDPRGKTIQFYQSGSFIDVIKKIPVIGKMRKTFVPEATE